MAAIEARIARATRAWTDDLRAALIAEHGEQRGLELYAALRDGVPARLPRRQRRRHGDRRHRPHRASWLAAGRADLTSTAGGVTRADGPRQAAEHQRRSRCRTSCRSSSTWAPRSSTSVPYEISPARRGPVWVYDFGLRCDPEDLDRAGDAFAAAFLGAWSGELEDDRLNGLVMRAGLSGREVTIVRAVLRYLRQSTIAFSDAYMIQTLLDNPQIARRAVALFAARFDPDAHDAGRAERARGELEAAIDAVESLDADRILRSFLAVLRAMLRTNYYRLVGRATPPSPLPLPVVQARPDPAGVPAPAAAAL